MSVYTHALATNNYGESSFIVSASPANGTHVTIASALAAAVSGQTIFIREGTYTENPTLKAGVNLVAYTADAYTPNVKIIGKCSYSSAGTVSISGIQLQTNSDYFLEVTGSAASIVYLINCGLTMANNTGINFTTANTGAAIYVNHCNGNIATTGIGAFTATSTGSMRFNYCNITNTGNSSTASSATNTTVYLNWSQINFPCSTASAGSIYFTYCNVNNEGANATCLTTAGTGSSNIEFSDFLSGSASCISVGTGTTVLELGTCRFDSSNTNPVTGAGTFKNSVSYYTSTGSSNNVTTQTFYPGGGWQLIQTQNASNSATISFTNLLGFSYFKVLFKGVIPATNGTFLQVVSSTNGGSSYANSGYQSGVQVWNYDSGTITNYNLTTAFRMSGNTSNATGQTSGELYIPASALSFNGSLNYYDSGAGKWSFAIFGGGNGAASTINAIRFLMASGNITSGVFSLYGISI